MARTRPADAAGAVTWDDTVDRIATWRDRHHTARTTPGLGPRPHDATTAEAWLEQLEAVLTTRAWLATRNPTTEPIDLHELGPAAVQERIGQLDALLAAAPPPNQTRILHDLLAARLHTDDLHAALAAARQTQGGRRDWILNNWAHVVEREQLQRLADRYGPLADWLPAISATVRDTLDRLAAHTPPPATREDRGLATLHDLLNRLDSGRHLEALTAQLTTLRTRVHGLQAQLDESDDPATRTLLADEHHLWTARVEQATLAVDAERDRLLAARIYRTDQGSLLTDSVALRHRTVLHDTLHQRPVWVIGLLEELDGHGNLDSLPRRALAELIGAVAVYRDRWSIDDPRPLGPTPDPAVVERRIEWEQLITRLRPEHLIAGPVLSIQR